MVVEHVHLRICESCRRARRDTVCDYEFGMLKVVIWEFGEVFLAIAAPVCERVPCESLIAFWGGNSEVISGFFMHYGDETSDSTTEPNQWLRETIVLFLQSLSIAPAVRLKERPSQISAAISQLSQFIVSH
jgi:hypothetical protein